MYKGHSFSLILPAFNEEKSIFNVINSFDKLNIFDEIIVVDNNSTDSTPEIVKSTNAKYILEKVQGYGAAIIRGLDAANTDYVILCETDSTFDAEDTFRFIDLIDKYDCVFGTRTDKNYIYEGAKMQHYLRYGNILMAKFLSFLFGGPKISDVGCTYKLLSRNSYKKIINQLITKGSELQPELMIRLINNEFNIIEIPVKYFARKGYSKITYNFNSSFKVALKMFILIVNLRIERFYNEKN